MSPVVFGLAFALLVPACLSWVPRYRTVATVAATAGVGLTFCVAIADGPASGPLAPWGAIVCGLLAAIGGGPFTAQVLDWAETLARRGTGGEPGAADPDQTIAAPAPPPAPVLRGGAWIGVLERLGIAAGLLCGWPEAVPVVLAVKGLGRYPELKHGTSERFIIGTFVSVLWAVAACGISLVT